MQAFKTVLLLLLAGSTHSLLADEHRQHGAHEHGVGKLDIAKEGSELHIELDSPAVNIVGFEHVPESKADHDALGDALARLKDGTGLFLMPDAAGCRLVDVRIKAPMGEHEDEEQHDDEHHEDEHRDDDHAHKDDHDEDGETHSDISATWRFSCARPERLDTVRVKLFDAFPLTERLQVQFVTPERQGAAELSASQPALRF